MFSDFSTKHNERNTHRTQQTPSTSSQHFTQTSRPYIKKEISLSIVQLKLINTEENALTNKKNPTELQLYLSEPVVKFSKNFNILNWWKENQSRFPILSQISRDNHAIQATSLSSERNFSCSGLTVTKLRNGLHPQTIRELMCLRSWIVLLKKRAPEKKTDIDVDLVYFLIK